MTAPQYLVWLLHADVCMGSPVVIASVRYLNSHAEAHT